MLNSTKALERATLHTNRTDLNNRTDLANRTDPRECDDIEIELSGGGPNVGPFDALWRLVRQTFPDALEPLKVALSVIAIGCLKRPEPQPVVVVFVGPASSGKTLIFTFFEPHGDDDELSKYLYRSDKFTPQSFVSHRADKTNEELKHIDLLPKIQEKTLLTKELAPFFRGERDELTQRFAALTSILDGQGFFSDSGAQGRRGYPGPIDFRWLGASTPLSDESLAAMASLGPRILFYTIDGNDRTEEEELQMLTDLAQDATQDTRKAKIRKCTRKALAEFFRSIPLQSVAPDAVQIPQARARELALAAQLTAKLRSIGATNSEPEKPFRVLRQFQLIAQGSALIHGRRTVTKADTARILHIVLSSCSWSHGKLLRALVQLGGCAHLSDIQRVTRLSPPTIRRAAEKLQELGVVQYAKGTNNQPANVWVVGQLKKLVDLLCTLQQ